MNNKILVFCLLTLTVFSMMVQAENIPLTEQQIQQHGTGKIQLDNGIGVIVFNMSEQTNSLNSEGMISVTNTNEYPVSIQCTVIDTLSVVDLDEQGKPRIHTRISDKVTFTSIPDPGWIHLTEEEFTINPLSTYQLGYSVFIPGIQRENLRSDTGFLCYINVKKISDQTSGAQIGIDYNYKVFLLFTDIVEPVMLNMGVTMSEMFGAFILVLAVMFVGVLYWDKRKNKQTPRVFKDDVRQKPMVNNNVTIEDTSQSNTDVVASPHSDSDDIDKQVDDFFNKNARQRLEDLVG